MLPSSFLIQKQRLAQFAGVNHLPLVRPFVQSQISRPQKLDIAKIALMVFAHMRAHLFFVKKCSVACFAFQFFTANMLDFKMLFNVFIQVIDVCKAFSTLITGGLHK